MLHIILSDTSAYLGAFVGGFLAGLAAVVAAGVIFLRWLDGVSAAQLYEDAYPERAESAQ